MKRLIAIIFTLCALQAYAQENTTSLYHIDSVEICASPKSGDYHLLPISSTAMAMHKLEHRGVTSAKELSAIAPNFYQPDYGSSITSSIYIRGFGSRIDQPVMGMTIDEAPVMNKNGYDFDFYDIRRIELLRGPQGTLYGRNTSGGVMNITTLSPMVWQGVRAMAEYSTVNSYRASAAYYAKPKEDFGISIAGGYSHSGGFFKNILRNEMCDSGDNASLRLRTQWLTDNWSFDNSLSAGYTLEGGYAYHPYDSATGRYSPIAYNDPSGYERLTINEGFVAKHKGKVDLTSITTYSYLGDKMTLDQDFSPKSMFTMQQRQREHSITEDIVIRNKPNDSRWQWLTGAFLFAKWLDMSSPVTFKEDGINELILGNINNGIHTVFPDNSMTFGCDNFVINSDFVISTYGAALYHQSVFNLDRWQITAGLRLDMEHVTMRYNSNATIPYRFDLTMDNYRDLLTEFKGRDSQTFFEVLPKIAVRYTLNSRNNIYATITRGYKSGGFNTQIFSDILQVKMMNDMMDALGIELDNGATTTTYDSASATRYKPEKSWNFELGTHLQPLNGLSIDAALFWIECFDQQVTILPKGMSTGRMMSNAARARSLGIELAAEYNYKGLSASVGYGYTNARFRDYDDGMESYGGNFLPYAPQNTINAIVGYTWHIADSRLEEITITADWRGLGRIYWNESNTLSQPLYSLLGMQLSLDFKKATLTIWGRNLTNSDYDTFYFKSVGKEFFSKGAPIHGGIRVNINI